MDPSECFLTLHSKFKLSTDLGAHDVLVERNRLVEVGGGDGHVVEPSQRPCREARGPAGAGGLLGHSLCCELLTLLF